MIGISSSRSDEGAVMLASAYLDAVSRSGGDPVILPVVEDSAQAERLVASVDGIIFSGGADLTPGAYGEEIWNETVEIDSVRDRSDMALAQAALSSGKPVLGICRGAQLLNVVLGGTLVQDLPTQWEGAGEHNGGVWHRIGVEQGSVLFRLYGSDSLSVSSFHHQAVKDPARDIRVTARSADGVLEAFEYGQHVLAVQFHPEKMVLSDPSWLALFQYFVGMSR